MEELTIDTRSTEKRLVGFLRTEMASRGFRRAVLGVSGGVDSSLVAALAERALGKANVLGIYMPYHTNAGEVRDVRKLVRQLGIRFMTIDIRPVVDAYFKMFPKADRIRRGNMMARVRMSVLFDRSKVWNGLVLGSGNRTEFMLGYFTQHGDSAYAIDPIAGLYKTQVRQLARALSIPEPIVAKAPTAGLWPDQTDEGELGFTYADADRVLYLSEKGYSKRELAKKGLSRGIIQKVMRRVAATEFKRNPPAVPKSLKS